MSEILIENNNENNINNQLDNNEYSFIKDLMSDNIEEYKSNNNIYDEYNNFKDINYNANLSPINDNKINNTKFKTELESENIFNLINNNKINDYNQNESNNFLKNTNANLKHNTNNNNFKNKNYLIVKVDKNDHTNLLNSHRDLTTSNYKLTNVLKFEKIIEKKKNCEKVESVKKL